MKRLLLVLALLCLCLVPAFAQDATVEATVEAAPVTVIDGDGEGTTVIVEAPETPSEGTETPTSFLSQVIEFVMGAIVGAGLMLGSAAAWIRSAMHDPVKMTLAEAAGRNISPETLKQFLDFLGVTRDFAIEATDGVPMVSKQPSSNSNISSTGADFSSTAPRMP